MCNKDGWIILILSRRAWSMGQSCHSKSSWSILQRNLCIDTTFSLWSSCDHSGSTNQIHHQLSMGRIVLQLRMRSERGRGGGDVPTWGNYPRQEVCVVSEKLILEFLLLSSCLMLLIERYISKCRLLNFTFPPELTWTKHAFLTISEAWCKIAPSAYSVLQIKNIFRESLRDF